MWTKLFVLILSFVFVSGTSVLVAKPQILKDDPEMLMSTPEMIQYFGYPVETHVLTSPDGYIIQIFRIPYGLTRSDGPRTPVMIQHGLLCSSSDWVINFPHQSLGFAAADAGYDVWLGNVRGNVYGRNHTSLNPDKDDSFWHFSWDQMSDTDAPMMIDYIIAQTGYAKIYYVGHSLGTTMAFAMLSTPELDVYNDKITTFVALAPLVTVNHIKSPIKYLAPFANEMNFLLLALGTGEFLPSSEVTAWLAQECVADIPLLCQNIVFIIGGYDLEELNTTRLDVYVAHTPAGTSTWTVVHYAQEINMGRFRHCDWGISENYKRYGQSYPPDYDVSRTRVPTVLMWGANDYLADPQDVDILSYQLPNLIDSIQIGGPNYAHMDFAWGINTGTYVNPVAFKYMPRY
ncbi:hypothetical protein CHUAL_003963 [Chamberlinius hualienensis]